jgi:hypothetical protein
MDTTLRPEPGQIWDQKPTAGMIRDRVTRTVRVESVDIRWVYVAPAEGKGRRTHVEIPSFLRKFTLRPHYVDPDVPAPADTN